MGFAGIQPRAVLAVQLRHQGTINTRGGIQIRGQCREMLLDLMGCLAGLPGQVGILIRQFLDAGTL
jgi:hypothetical protein